MNWMIIICETVIMTIAFTAMVMIPLVKNPVWWIHDYPKEFDHAIVDEIRIVRPLAVRAEDTIHTGMWYVEHNFVDVCHLLWFGF